jgi:hypothetical protein
MKTRKDRALNKSEILSLLRYYNITVKTSSSKSYLQKKLNNVMSDKFCRCVKKVNPRNEAYAIGTCTRVMFKNKGLKRGAFKCTPKTKRNIQFKTKGLTLKKRK